MKSIRISALLSAALALPFLFAATPASADADAFYYEREDSVVTSSVVTGSATTPTIVAESQRFDEPE